MISIPAECPSCNSRLQRVKDQLFCRSKLCPTQRSKVVENYAKKVKIKGLGPAAINKLDITTIGEIYELDRDYLEEVIGKNGLKIYTEIQNKKSIELALFLGSASIPLMGHTTAKKITTTIDDITRESLAKDGIGNKASESLLKWLSENDIPAGVTFTQSEITEPSIASFTVCVSGRTPGFTKATLAEYLKKYNVKVVSSVTKDIDYLISEEKTSAKAQKALKLNKPILSIKQFIENENLE
ncbi:MAG: hypothetical protein GY707_05335 [Desulfobacteraceae bacterium]|nr:hypothetical protein [Desulfobacteraceae bacterium]